jgi:succinoglycan biosynthesis transport protein ExoP
MLDKPRWHVPSRTFGEAQTTATPAREEIKPLQLLGVLRRQWLVIAGAMTVMLGLGIAYISYATPRYTATARMIMDTRKVQVLQQQQSIFTDATVDPTTVESQVEVLRSENVADAVIKELDLTKDPEFNGEQQGILGTILGVFRGGPELTDYARARLTLDTFQKKMVTRRVGLTYVMEVGFESNSAEKAAKIANAIANAYIVDQLDAKYQATRRASSWLQDRIKELKVEAQTAERAVEDYKSANNIVDTGGSRLLNEQQLAELSSQLITARAQRAEAKARLDRIQAVNTSGIPDAAVTDVLSNEVITRLRQQYLDASKKEADWAAKYGKDHTAAANLRIEMKQIERVITDELRRIAETYKSDYEIAKVREDSLQNSLDEAIKQTSTTNQDRVVLRDLESAAQTYRALYDSFLQRFMETTQQQSFPMTDARIITPASQPLVSSHPKTVLIVGFSGILGLALGVAAAFGREHLDRAFRLPSQVEAVTNSPCLGILPSVPAIAPAEPRAPRFTGPRLIKPTDARSRYVVQEPFSRFTESIRSIKVAVDLANFGEKNKVVGVVSASPKEGKSTVSSNFAQLAALTGKRVLLIDADLRNPSLTRHFAPQSTGSLLEVVTGRANLTEVVWVDPETGLIFLPAPLSTPIAHTSELLSSDRMGRFLDDARELFDLVIVDLPPIAPIVDVRASSMMMDSFVLVIEWGRTSQELVQEALHSAPLVTEKLLGTVLNKADPAMLKTFEAYKGRHYNDYYKPSEPPTSR